jgi:hypothetical protein
LDEDDDMIEQCSDDVVVGWWFDIVSRIMSRSG